MDCAVLCSTVCKTCLHNFSNFKLLQSKKTAIYHLLKKSGMFYLQCTVSVAITGHGNNHVYDLDGGKKHADDHNTSYLHIVVVIAAVTLIQKKSYTIYYNIDNWVCICWSGQESNYRRHGLHVVGPHFFIGVHYPPRVAIHSRNTIYSADMEIHESVW